MIGFSEFSLIGIIALILLKPNDYPNIIRKIRYYYSLIREYILNLKNELYSHLELEETNSIKSQIDEFHKQSEDLKEKFREDFVVFEGKKYLYGDDKQLHEIYELPSKVCDFPKDSKK